MNYIRDIFKGSLGMSFSFGSFAVAMVEVELYLKIISLVVGIVVGLLTAMSICQSIVLKHRQRFSLRTSTLKPGRFSRKNPVGE